MQVLLFFFVQYSLKTNLLSARCKNSELIQYLISHSVPVNKRDTRFEISALDISINLNDKTSFSLLLPHYDQEGKNVGLSCGAWEGNLPIVKELIAVGASFDFTSSKFSPLYTATQNRHFEVVEYLLQNSWDPNMPSLSNGFTALHVAVAAASPDIIELLIKYKADVNKVPNAGATPLLIACEEGLLEIAEILLKAGADPNYQTPSESETTIYPAGTTAL